MSSTDVATAITEGQAIGDEILESIAALAPGVAVPAALAEAILNLLAKYVGKAIVGYNAAAAVPITADSILALLPNQTPLSAPDAP
ncbi:MAG TPA: hypothetical protein VN517_03740 [Terriglobales bacterium]|nr:hypothetical protein [Terriglobales bacterium]